MAYLITEPQTIAAVATNVEEIGTAIDAANATAAAPISGLMPAAADEVSTAIANLFGSYGRGYQAVVTQAAAFHTEFVQALAAAGSAYANAEAAAQGALGTLLSPTPGGSAPLNGNAATGAAGGSGPLAPASGDPLIALIMGGTGNPLPNQPYVTNNFNLFIAPKNPTAIPQGLSTPEELYPLTGVKSLPLYTSVSEGITILNNAIFQQIGAGNTVIVFGYSQSAIITSLEMQNLGAMGSPNTTSLSFVLAADPMNPNGGLLERFAGLTLPSLGVDFYGATPPNTLYQTTIYSREYDGFADFPRYPIDVVSDLNAVMGIAFVHPGYQHLTLAQVNSATHLATDPAYGTNTNYYMIATPNLPLLDPLRAVPYVGNPLADLLQPDLKVLVNWGYGDPAYGYSTSYANVPTPFGLLPPLSATTALPAALVAGTQQGFSAFASDVSTAGFGQPPALSLSSLSNVLASNPLAAPGALPAPTLSAPSINSFIPNLQAAITNFTNAITSASSTAYATLLPTADIANAALTSIPSYDVNLFLSGIEQVANGDPAGLPYMFFAPIAADAGLVTVAVGVEALVLLGATSSIVKDFTSLVP